ncbi:ribosome maturation factor RimM [Thalassobacillus sp. CUG 92003]|uniref:ribosome maturation factor RimM n=1 Tax=Thalassobacillus sp. CUG 92003 TaxID=2736641 RepID=UPI002105BDDD|nr:ribosome maturation factor RimM [Thalassobacillus sp. CUG 92003]
MTDRQTMYNVGKIINTHGVKGEVKVHRITDFDERFQPGQLLYLMKDGHEPAALTISNHRFHKGFDLLTFEDHHSINDVEAYKDGMLKVSENQLQELQEDEFYFHEIIGCDVYHVNGEKIGVIKEILTPGANDVWVVEREGSHELLLPFIEDVVKDIDTKAQVITIDPIEGLLD